jgi:hypothetical protein
MAVAMKTVFGPTHSFFFSFRAPIRSQLVSLYTALHTWRHSIADSRGQVSTAQKLQYKDLRAIDSYK